jgi:hypothetical protein
MSKMLRFASLAIGIVASVLPASRLSVNLGQQALAQFEQGAAARQTFFVRSYGGRCLDFASPPKEGSLLS